MLEPTLLNATVVLKTGTKFKTKYSADTKWVSADLTSGTIHRINVNGNVVFFQGDNVDHIVIEPSGVQV